MHFTAGSTPQHAEEEVAGGGVHLGGHPGTPASNMVQASLQLPCCPSSYSASTILWNPLDTNILSCKHANIMSCKGIDQVSDMSWPKRMQNDQRNIVSACTKV